MTAQLSKIFPGSSSLKPWGLCSTAPICSSQARNLLAAPGEMEQTEQSCFWMKKRSPLV